MVSFSASTIAAESFNGCKDSNCFAAAVRVAERLLKSDMFKKLSLVGPFLQLLVFDTRTREGIVKENLRYALFLVSWYLCLLFPLVCGICVFNSANKLQTTNYKIQTTMVDCLFRYNVNK